MDVRKRYIPPEDAHRVDTIMLNGKSVDVVRGDLVGDGKEYPRWGKIEAIDVLLASNAIDKSKPLAHLSVHGSWTGWTLSKLCPLHGIEFVSAYPDSKLYPPELLHRIESNGATMHPMKPNMMAVMENKLKGDCKKNGWQMLPHAFNHPIYVEYMQKKMEEIIKGKDYTHLVLGVGSGVTAAGLIKGFLKYDTWEDILNNKRKVHGMTMSSMDSTMKTLNENKAGDANNINIYPSLLEFNDPMDGFEVPFDCNEFWEKKSWKWLSDNIDRLDGNILFWNVGGSYSESIKYLAQNNTK